MARYMILDGNTVTNIVEAEADFAASQGWIQDDQAGICWAYDGEAFAPPVTITATPIYPTLTRKQLRNGLLSIGVTSAEVEAQIGTIADPLEREAALIDWQETQAYERTNPLVNQIGVAMGLPEAQIDALWMWAAGLQ